MNLKYNFKKIILLILLLFLYIFVSFLSYANTISTDLSKNIFRLHVIANSNSQEDQDLKYLVRNSYTISPVADASAST